MYTLLLGSSSSSRQQLLTDAKIPFRMLGHSADETACDWGLPLQNLVETIAVSKMEHVILAPSDQNTCFVLTADTLSHDITGTISGKPIDRDDARQKLKAARHGMYTGTAFCLDKCVWHSDAWQREKRIIRFVGARYRFIVPDEWIETYLDASFALTSSGAIAIEGYGGLFLQDVQGSYTTIVGLPLFELRQALSELGFFTT
jgi:septum formation protein